MLNNTARFHDVEALLVTVLPATVGVPVVTKVPAQRPDRFVRVERTGGPRATRVSDQPTVVVESWGSSESDAAELASMTRQAIASLAGSATSDTWVYAVDEASGPANLPDPRTSQTRYTQTFAIHLRGVTT